MDIRENHRKLYKKIPAFNCKPGCTDCCGPVPISPWEAEQLGIPGKELTPVKPGTLQCTFATKTGCSVYDKRPMICRLFGTVDHKLMTCPHGCRPKKQIPGDKANHLTNQYTKLIARQG